MRLPSSSFRPLLALCLIVGCDGGEKDKAAAAPAAATTAADAEEEAKDEPKPKSKKASADEDKGTAELTLGDDGEVWKAKRAYARIKDDGKLRISASVQTTVDDTTSRRQLTLSLNEYKGPGKYVVTNMSSSLTAVKLNFDKIKKAEAEGDKAKTDAAATKLAVDGMKGASVLLLRDAKVEITKADDDFIDGSITWSGVALNGPGKLSGTFHARVKE